MADNPTKPTVQEADVAALIARVRARHKEGPHVVYPHLPDLYCRECLAPWPCPSISLSSALERAQADTAAIKALEEWLAAAYSRSVIVTGLTGAVFCAVSEAGRASHGAGATLPDLARSIARRAAP